MKLISRVTAAALQQQTLVLDNGASFAMQLYYRPMQQGWFLNELSYQSFILRGIRVVNSPNLLNQWRNLIPFGLGCFSSGNRDPQLQKDFLSGASKLYVLSQAECDEYAEFLTRG